MDVSVIIMVSLYYWRGLRAEISLMIEFKCMTFSLLNVLWELEEEELHGSGSLQTKKKKGTWKDEWIGKILISSIMPHVIWQLSASKFTCPLGFHPWDVCTGCTARINYFCALFVDPCSLLIIRLSSWVTRSCLKRLPLASGLVLV